MRPQDIAALAMEELTMATSRKERRAQTAMRTIMGIGGMTAISLLMLASPAKAGDGQSGYSVASASLSPAR